MIQVISIHGGTTFSTYEKYIDYLRTKEVSIDRFTSTPTWRDGLQHALGDSYQVLLPRMPNATNAQYHEWKIWFDRIAEVAEDGCVLIGHSLGGVFLAKYLSENQFPKQIRATILIAAPYDDETVEDLTDFKISEVSELFRKQAGKVTLFHGSDDPVVSMSDLQKYKAELPDVEFIVLSAPDHFVRPAFPELIEKIQELSILPLPRH